MKKLTKCVAISMMASIIGMTSIASVGAAVCDSDPVIAGPDSESVIARPDGMYSVKAAAPNVQTTREYVLGDSNGDGRITISDSTFIQKYLVEKLISGYEYDMVAMDVNKDGKVDVYDATCVQRHVAEFTDAKTQEVGKTFTTTYKKDGVTLIDPKYQEGVGVGGGIVDNVEVVAEVEGKKEYQKVDNWRIYMNNADGSYGQYTYVAKADSEAKEDAGNSALEAGYMNSRLAYEDENGNSDPSKATIYWEKNDDGATPVGLKLRKGIMIDRSDDIAFTEDGFIEAYNADKGKYTFDLPLLEETGVTAKVSWDAIGNKDTYSVQLYKDGTAIGDAKTVDGTECTFEGLDEGSYTVIVTPNVSGRAVRKEFTVQTEAEGNNDSEEVTRIQTAVKSLNFCNNCGCWLDGSVFDHIITHEDWDKLKDEAATYDSTSVNALSGVPYYHDHTQYYLNGFTTQDLVDVHVNPITEDTAEKYGVGSGASYVEMQINARTGRNLERLRPDGDYTIFLKQGEVPVDMNVVEPYKQGSVVEDGQAYAGNCGLIFVNSRTELDDFVQASMDIAKNKSFVGERGYTLENGRPKIVFKPYAAEDFIRFSFMDFHRSVQGCNGGYHDEDVRVITGYEKDMTPETYTAKLTVK